MDKGKFKKFKTVSPEQDAIASIEQDAIAAIAGISRNHTFWETKTTQAAKVEHGIVKGIQFLHQL